jgi:hypothetical protein
VGVGVGGNEEEEERKKRKKRNCNRECTYCPGIGIEVV